MLVNYQREPGQDRNHSLKQHFDTNGGRPTRPGPRTLKLCTFQTQRAIRKLTNILQNPSRGQHQHVNQSGGNRKWLPHGKHHELLSGFWRVSESPPASWIPGRLTEKEQVPRPRGSRSGSGCAGTEGLNVAAGCRAHRGPRLRGSHQ